MSNFQITFGWAEQGTCEECGTAFIHTYPFSREEYDWHRSFFFSSRFCSQECASISFKRIKENDQIRKDERRKWG